MISTEGHPSSSGVQIHSNANVGPMTGQQTDIRHDICQKIYATTVLAGRILRKKSVNWDIRQFATKERKCFKMA